MMLVDIQGIKSFFEKANFQDSVEATNFSLRI